MAGRCMAGWPVGGLHPQRPGPRVRSARAHASEFQLAGDSERPGAHLPRPWASTSGELDLPVPVDRRAYRAAADRLIARGIVRDGRLTPYGHGRRGPLPVDRPWGELLVHAEEMITPYVAVMANIDSLHRMTREDRDLRGLVVHAATTSRRTTLCRGGESATGTWAGCTELPRHLFHPTVEEWAAARGSAREGAGGRWPSASPRCTGRSSCPCRETLPAATGRCRPRVPGPGRPGDALRPGDRAGDGAGRAVRVSRGSVCAPNAAVAGQVRTSRTDSALRGGAIEGTEIPST